MSTFQQVYPDESISLFWDKSVTADGVTASNYVCPGGDSFSIIMPVTATSIVYVQANNCNPILGTGDAGGTIFYANNPLLNQPSMAKKIKRYPNTTFPNHWITIDSMAAGTSGYFSNKNNVNVPVRYVRLLGNALTAAGWYADFWSEPLASLDVRFK